jgi:hypothetical protein
MQPLQPFSSPPTSSTLQHDYILLDGSSSMETKWWDTLVAIEAYISGLKAENVNSHIILQTFDSTALDFIQRNEPITSWKPLTTNPIGSYWGCTPLYDAISAMGRRLRDLNPPRCSILIVTDGQENGSQFTSLVQAKAILDWCRAKGWQITFIGANFNNSEQASLLGASPSSAIGVGQKRLSDATSSLAKKRAAYGLYGTDMHFSEGERQQFGGYLSAPKGG